MPLPLNALLALKALQIGAGTAISPSRHVALSMLGAAIDYLDGQQDTEGQARLAFYLAARAEALRAIGDPTADRESLKRVCGSAPGSVYEWFMRVEEATEARSGLRSQGSTSPYVRGGGTSREADNDFISPAGRAYRAIEALGLSRSRLTASESRLLEKTTLKELLDKHGIPFAA